MLVVLYYTLSAVRYGIENDADRPSLSTLSRLLSFSWKVTLYYGQERSLLFSSRCSKIYETCGSHFFLSLLFDFSLLMEFDVVPSFVDADDKILGISSRQQVMCLVSDVQ